MTTLTSWFAVLSTLCAATSTQCASYTSTYDHIDVEAILGNERLFRQYMSCILRDGPCTADGRTFKQLLPDAIKTSCMSCSDVQKTNVRTIASYIKSGKPEVWKEFNDKYNPSGAYTEYLEEVTATAD